MEAEASQYWELPREGGADGRESPRTGCIWGRGTVQLSLLSPAPHRLAAPATG